MDAARTGCSTDQQGSTGQMGGSQQSASENSGEQCMVPSTAAVLREGAAITAAVEAAEAARAAANGGCAPTTDERGLPLSKKWAGSQVVRLAHAYSDVSLMDALELSETANTRTEFEAKTTQRKEYFKLVEVMYNSYSSRESDPLSPWPELPSNLYKDQFPDLRTLNPQEVDQYRDSDYLKRVWDKLRRRIRTVMEAYERSGQNDDGTFKDPWDFRFLTMPPGTAQSAGKSRCVFEIFYCFLISL